MATYSTNLALTLLTTGEGAGTWGNTTNTNLGTLLEQAISGYVTQAVSTGTDTTLTIPNGATGVARNMYIELTGTGGTNTNLIVPSNKKLYFIFNNSTGAVTVKVTGQTGVSVPTGKKMVLVSNGTDIVNGLNYIADFGTNSFTVSNLTATSATITTLTSTSANVTTLSGTTATYTSATLSNLGSGSANITTLTSASATITNLLGTTLTISGNTFLATSSGNVGIGTSSPASLLHLSAGTTVVQRIEATSTNPAFIIHKNNGSDRMYVGTESSTGAGIIGTGAAYAGVVSTASTNPLVLGTNGTEKARISSAGGLGVGTTADPGAGAIFATGNITAYYSDARLKDFKGKIGDALYKISQLNGYYYTENVKAEEFGYNNKAMQVGVSAQEVKAVLPEVVSAAPFDLDEKGQSKSGENYMTVRYDRLVPLLIEAVKELSAKVEALEGKK